MEGRLGFSGVPMGHVANILWVRWGGRGGGGGGGGGGGSGGWVCVCVCDDVDMWTNGLEISEVQEPEITGL